MSTTKEDMQKKIEKEKSKIPTAPNDTVNIESVTEETTVPVTKKNVAPIPPAPKAKVKVEKKDEPVEKPTARNRKKVEKVEEKSPIFNMPTTTLAEEGKKTNDDSKIQLGLDLGAISGGAINPFDDDNSFIINSSKATIREYTKTLTTQPSGDRAIYTHKSETQLYFTSKDSHNAPNDYTHIGTTTAKTQNEIIKRHLEEKVVHIPKDNIPFEPKFNIEKVSAKAIKWDKTTGIYSLDLDILLQDHILRPGTKEKVQKVIDDLTTKLQENSEKKISTSIGRDAGDRAVYIDQSLSVLYFASDDLKSTNVLNETHQDIGSLTDEQLQAIFDHITEDLVIHYVKPSVKLFSWDWILSAVSDTASLSVAYAVNTRLTNIPWFQQYIGSAAVSALAVCALASFTTEFMRLSVLKGRCPTTEELSPSIQHASALTLKVAGGMFGQLAGEHYANLAKNTELLKYTITGAISGICAGLIDTFSKLSQGNLSLVEYLKEGFKTFATMGALATATNAINKNITAGLLNIKQEDVEWAKAGISVGATTVVGFINPVSDVVFGGAKFCGDKGGEKLGSCSSGFFRRKPALKTDEEAPLTEVKIETSSDTKKTVASKVRSTATHDREYEQRSLLDLLCCKKAKAIKNDHPHDTDTDDDDDKKYQDIDATSTNKNSLCNIL